MPGHGQRDVGRGTLALAFVIRAARLAAKHSVHFMGEMVAIPTSTFSKLETGATPIDAEQIIRIAGFLGCTAGQLLDAADLPEDASVDDVVTRLELARRAIDLTGSPQDLLRDPKIDEHIRKRGKQNDS